MVLELRPTEGSDGGLAGHGRPRDSSTSLCNSVPAHLQDLLERGAAHLDGEERCRLASLQEEFKGAFTGPDGRLG